MGTCDRIAWLPSAICLLTLEYLAGTGTSSNQLSSASLQRRLLMVCACVVMGAALWRRRYVLEVFSGHFTLPDLGPIGGSCFLSGAVVDPPVLKHRSKANVVTEGDSGSCSVWNCAGANGLANARDFQTPVAAFQEAPRHFTVLHKFEGELFQVCLGSWVDT